ncbi:hypothetical protein [uncultured Leifsonia sp.]|jgi:hypothetical protein|uniref:hypothetical protein n=1 Tax=Leifsonia sp. TaxID=1870902 RepID=UPI0028D153B0|nr:hypothetical protein [uncultured Leifsonia sp.]
MNKVEGRLGARAGRAAEWLDAKLLPVLGPPPLGPYGPETARTEAATCPLCGARIDLHVMERDHGHAFLICPSPARTQLQVA